MVAFKQVDVFTQVPFKGNPVAVIMDATSLSVEDMKAIAIWTNLSETTFVFPPTDPSTADYLVRIFTPSGSELPFAGHPTVGTSYALLEAGLVTPHDGKLVQECGAGLINLTVTKDDTFKSFTISFETPKRPIIKITEDQILEIEDLISSPISRFPPPSIVDVGPKWVVAKLPSVQEVLNVKPDFAKMAQHDQQMDVAGLIVFGYYSEDPNHVEVRAFAPADGVNEDPVCGSGNASVMSLIKEHYSGDYCTPVKLASTQGQILGRDGHLQLEFTRDKVLVGGHAVTCIDGAINI